MNNLKRWWLNIPRKFRIVLNLLAMVLLGLVIYVLLGSPALTPEMRLRRAEKANLVGPSQILEIVETEGGNYDYLIVADDGQGIILYSYNDYRTGSGDLVYRNKTGPITVLAAPDLFFGGPREYAVDLPVFLFHDYPRAVRAELELTLGEGLDMGDFEKSYLLEAHREIEGYFRFNLHAESEDWYVDESGIDRGTPLGIEGDALGLFSWMMTDYPNYSNAYIPATVRLYDESNTLIIEQDLTIRSAGGELYAQREELEPQNAQEENP